MVRMFCSGPSMVRPRGECWKAVAWRWSNTNSLVCLFTYGGGGGGGKAGRGGRSKIYTLGRGAALLTVYLGATPHPTLHPHTAPPNPCNSAPPPPPSSCAVEWVRGWGGSVTFSLSTRLPCTPTIAPHTLSTNPPPPHPPTTVGTQPPNPPPPLSVPLTSSISRRMTSLSR